MKAALNEYSKHELRMQTNRLKELCLEFIPKQQPTNDHLENEIKNMTAVPHSVSAEWFPFYKDVLWYARKELSLMENIYGPESHAHLLHTAKQISLSLEIACIAFADAVQWKYPVEIEVISYGVTLLDWIRPHTFEMIRVTE